jgi:hypothetical protein
MMALLRSSKPVSAIPSNMTNTTGTSNANSTRDAPRRLSWRDRFLYVLLSSER